MKKFRSIFSIAAFLLVGLCASTNIYAQSATATLSGTVMDERGATVAGANVTITNPATNLQRQATTSESGNFVIVQLPPSVYTLRVESTGFSATEIKDIEL